MKMTKQIPDRILKGMVLSAIEQGNSTTAEIRKHIATVPYYCEYSEIDEFGNPMNSNYYVYSNYGGLRRELTYLRHQGYIRKLGKKPPHRFELTKTGIEHCNNPFLKSDYKLNRMINEARKYADEILENDDRFMEAVKKYVNENHSDEVTRIVEKPVIKPENNLLEVDIGDGKTKQIEFYNGEVKAVIELKAVAEEQSRRLIEYEKIIRWYQSQEEVDNTKQINREHTTAERIAKRQALVDEYFSNNYMIDINFFRRWGGGMVPVTIKKVWDYNPFTRGSVEIMSRGNREFTRGHAVEMDEDLIITTEFYFYQESKNRNGIEIYGYGMKEPQLLKW